MSRFVCLNGDILPETAPTVSVFNHSYNYGDGIVEIMRTRGDYIIFFDDHWQRIMRNMTILGINNKLFPSKAEIAAVTRRLIHRNNLLKGSRLKLIIFKDYTGINNLTADNAGYSIIAAPVEHSIFTLQQKGILINIYADYPKLLGPASSFRTTSSVFNIIALEKAKANGFGDSVLINQNQHIVETTFSNLFIYKNEILYTPPLSDGCVNGVIREKTIEITLAKKITVETNKSITISDLYNASEVFLTSEVSGIKWVMGYRNKRYYNKLAKQLIELLNRKAGLIEDYM